MVPSKPVRPAPIWVGRTGALLAGLSAVVHLAGLAGHSMPHTVMVVAMAIGCFYCAGHLWTRASRSDWALVAIMGVGMIAAHQNMSMPGSHAGHHASSYAVDAVASMPAMNAAMAIAVFEVVFATTVLFLGTRSMSVSDLRWIPTV